MGVGTIASSLFSPASDALDRHYLQHRDNGAWGTGKNSAVDVRLMGEGAGNHHP